MSHERVPRRLLTWPLLLFGLLAAAGAAAVALRLGRGLGATTNMTDTWPWGLWKAFNVLCLIAVSAGGFSVAALVYVFGGERYHGYVRSAVLLALLGYGTASASLAVDIGIPWRIVNPLYLWSERSLLFEVAWCVMLYLTVLALEAAPALFERLGWGRLTRVWRSVVPIYAVLGLTLFTYVMSHSLAWAAGALGLFTALALVLPRVTRRPSTPVLLILFGVILSTLHQSSLGSLFLLVPHKLSHYWWSPRLPFHFLLSAVAVGLSALVLERTITARLYRRRLPGDRRRDLAGFVAGLLWLMLAFRLADVMVLAIDAADHGLARAFGGAEMGALFLTEVLLGVVVPASILSSRAGRSLEGPRALAAALVVGGVILNRLNVCILGMMLPGRYVPSPYELAVTAGAVAFILCCYSLGVKLLPIYAAGEAGEEPAREASP